MNTIFKWIGTLLPLFLLVMTLTGCDNPPWDAGMALSLKIDSPQNGTAVTTPTVMVSGRVLGSQSASARLTINGVTVPVKDHKYSTSATLTEGANVINVAAIAGSASLKKEVIVTYAPAK